MTKLYPARSTAGDGTCASAQHHQTNPDSDHDPDESGYAHAFDVTHDPAHGVDTYKIARQLAEKKDARVKYIISNHQIWLPSSGWRSFGGDPHTGHMHVSIYPAATFSTAPWWNRPRPKTLEEKLPGSPPNINPPLSGVVDTLTLRRGAVYVLLNTGKIVARGSAKHYGDCKGKSYFKDRRAISLELPTVKERLQGYKYVIRSQREERYKFPEK